MPSAADSTTPQPGAGRKGPADRDHQHDGGDRPTASRPPAPTAPPVTTTTGRAHRPGPPSGPRSNYNYGVLSVKVTVTGHNITNVTIASIDDGGNSRSQSIDQQSIPILEQQAISAQSANIQGVSGASYTSAGFVQSLQAALSQLGI